jgi:predicted glycoside hydrolase/deacetylase ChbG (UPF0249 family)
MPIIGKRLIVNADDFGLSAGINAAVLMAHECGILTSASLMVRQPAAEAAAAEASRMPRLSIGLHLDLGEWTCAEGTWKPIYEVVPVDDHAAVEKEVQRQIAMFRKMVGTTPSHLDSHQHVHRREPVRSIAVESARRMEIPLRHFTPAIRYCGKFYGQTDEGRELPEAISVERLIEMLQAISDGVTELSCHPSTDAEVAGMYCAERVREFEALCDPRVRAAVVAAGIEPCSFHDTKFTWTTHGGTQA